MSSSHQFVPRRLLGRVALALCLSGCTSWKTAGPSPAAVVESEQPRRVRVKLNDGRTVYLSRPRIAADSLFGVTYDAQGRATRSSIPLADLREVAVARVDAGKTAALIGGIGLTALIVAAAVSDDGGGGGGSGGGGGGGGGEGGYVSCPLVYSWTEGGWRLDSGTFGGAIVPALARTDVDNLLYAQAERGLVRLRVANEYPETDHIDAMSLAVVDHPVGTIVAPDGDGALHVLRAPRAPSGASDFRGRDVLARVRGVDGAVWESDPSGRDPEEPAGRRDGLELAFPLPAAAGDARLLVEASNTPWAAYLIQEMIRAHGRETETWYDSLDADPEMARRLGAQVAREAFLAVSVWREGRWVPQGLIWEAGPEISKRQALRLNLAGVAGDTLRVRLESAPSFWLIDHIAIDYGPPPPATVQAAAPVLARTHDGRDVRAALLENDGNEYVLERGEWAELVFAVPEPPEDRTRSYLIRSSGWYRIHSPGTGEPDRATLARLGEPWGMSRIATERLNAALSALERSAR